MFRFSIPFGKKKSPSPPVPATERVQALSRQGYSDAEIIRTLRTEGYSPSEAESAMKEAVRAATVSQPLQQPPAAQSREPSEGQAPPLPGAAEPPRPAEKDFLAGGPAGLPPLPEEKYGPSALPEIPGAEAPAPPSIEEQEFVPAVGKKTEEESRREIEEITEGLIEEKWGVFEKELEAMGERLEKADKRLTYLETAIAEFKGVKKDDIEQIKAAIGSYKESINEISEKIEAMERAMKDSMTPMMQSLRSLADTLKALKTKK
jgi:archaellum component FlaC